MDLDDLKCYVFHILKFIETPIKKKNSLKIYAYYSHIRTEGMVAITTIEVLHMLKISIE